MAKFADWFKRRAVGRKPTLGRVPPTSSGVGPVARIPEQSDPVLALLRVIERPGTAVERLEYHLATGEFVLTLLGPNDHGDDPDHEFRLTFAGVHSCGIAGATGSIPPAEAVQSLHCGWAAGWYYLHLILGHPDDPPLAIQLTFARLRADRPPRRS